MLSQSTRVRYLDAEALADIRTTELYSVRQEEAEVAARRIHIRVTGPTGK